MHKILNHLNCLVSLWKLHKYLIIINNLLFILFKTLHSNALFTFGELFRFNFIQHGKTIVTTFFFSTHCIIYVTIILNDIHCLSIPYPIHEINYIEPYSPWIIPYHDWKESPYIARILSLRIRIKESIHTERIEL